MKRKTFSLAAMAMTLLLAACGGKGQTTQTAVVTEEVKPAVKVANVAVRPVDQVRDYVGTVQAEVKNNIAPQAPGRINKIFVEVGDHVRKGQKLVQMDAANLQQLTLQIENQKVDFARVKELYAVGGVSKAEFDNMKMSLEVAESQYRNIMENTQLLSPIDGIVTARNYDAGDMYAMTAPIFTVEQIAPVKLLVGVSESDYSKVHVGDEVKVAADALPGQEFVGKINRIYPTVDPTTRTFTAEVKIDNSYKTLRPGMFVRATVNFGTNNNVVIPDVAVVKQQGSGERFVYVLNEDNTVSYTKVTLGRRMGAEYEVLEGIADSAKVVIGGQIRLKDGIKVIVNE